MWQINIKRILRDGIGLARLQGVGMGQGSFSHHMGRGGLG